MQKYLFLFSFIKLLSLATQNDVALPNTIIPKVYNLELTLSTTLSSRSYTGSLLFTFYTLEDINEVFLHSRQHQVSQIEAPILDESYNITANTTVMRESADIIRFSLSSNLSANRTYYMVMTFSGNLMITSDGFFRSAYSVFENGTERFM